MPDTALATRISSARSWSVREDATDALMLNIQLRSRDPLGRVIGEWLGKQRTWPGRHLALARTPEHSCRMTDGLDSRPAMRCAISLLVLAVNRIQQLWWHLD